MSTVYFNAPFDDGKRRELLYQGHLFVFAPTPTTEALVEHARAMIEEAFAPHDPLHIHAVLPVETTVEILAKLKPAFIHHPRCKELIQRMLREFGCDPEITYFDVPRMRSAYPKEYLSSGIAYAFHPHRDTWYSAPQFQLNWWMPIWDIVPDNAMAFHPRYWARPVKNGSHTYNYYRWNAESRANAAKHVKTDTRVQPRPEEPMETEPAVTLIPPPGGIILFSGAQMHSTVPNTAGFARYSIDFRTVNLDDARVRRGAPNVDSACTGTTMRDYLRVSDLSRVPEEVVRLYDDDELPSDGVLIYPSTAQEPEKVG